jgi:hypothetical protein
VSQVSLDLKLDWDEFDAPHLTDELGEFSRVSAGQATEDHLDGCSLFGAGSVVDEHPHGHLHIASPEISFETPQPNDVQSAERDFTEMAFVDVPREHAFAIAVARHLGELTRARNVALADVKPIS